MALQRNHWPFLFGIASPAIILLAGVFSLAQTPSNGAQERGADVRGGHVLPVQGNVYMLVGAGANITLMRFSTAKCATNK